MCPCSDLSWLSSINETSSSTDAAHAASTGAVSSEYAPERISGVLTTYQKRGISSLLLEERVHQQRASTQHVPSQDAGHIGSEVQSVRQSGGQCQDQLEIRDRYPLEVGSGSSGALDDWDGSALCLRWNQTGRNNGRCCLLPENRQYM